MPRKIHDKSINFDPASPNGVDANDVKYDAATTLKEKIDSGQVVPIAEDYASSQDTDVLKKVDVVALVQDVSPTPSKLGEWNNTSGTYTNGDFVSHNGGIYKCLVANDFNAAKEPGVDIYYWKDVTTQFESDPVMSDIHLYGEGGFGSTNTAIRRFANSEVIGSDLTYTDDATNGGYITVNKSGLYNISYSDEFNNIEYMGVTRNSDQLTLAISDNANDPYRLCVTTTPASSYPSSCSVVKYLNAGDVLRAHVGPSAANDAGSTNMTHFRVTRLGDLESQGSFTRETSVLSAWQNVTHSIPDSAPTRYIYDTELWKISGEVDYNPTTGVVTFLKAGKYTIRGGIGLASVSGSLVETYVYHNETRVSRTNMSPPGSSAIETVAPITIDVEVGDTADIRVFQNSGSTKTTYGTREVSYIQVERSLAGDATATDKGELHTFTNADLNAGILTITHQLGQKHVIQTMVDNDGDQVPVWPTFVNNNTIQYDLTGITVTGTWSVALGIGGRSVADIMTATQKDVISSDYSVLNVDAGRTIDMDSPVDQDVNIQLNSTEPISQAGRQWLICRLGVGNVSIVAEAGVTLNDVDGGIATISDQFSSVVLRCKDPVNNVWVLEGNHGGVA